MALKDDHSFYLHKDIPNKSHKGKLFLIDLYDFETLEIFFDDHVEEDDTSIIDIWDIRVLKRLESKDRININLFKVDIIKIT